MSFSADAKNEIVKALHQKRCCRCSYAAGLLVNAEAKGSDLLVCTNRSSDVIWAVQKAINSAFGKGIKMSETTGNRVSGFSTEIICTDAVSLTEKLQCGEISELLTCPECTAAFLKGLFVGCASLTDPEKQYHLEFAVKDEKRAAAVAEFLSENISAPSIVSRKNGVGLVYKSSSAIEDILSVMGANQAYFSMVNGKIERDIRNNENRATNCETRNIAKSVDAAGRQIAAIERLKAEDKYETLPQSLKETAEMRVLYPSLPLSELASKFAPPLTKSGLNNRLKKIIELAE